MNRCDHLIDYFNQHLSEEDRVKFEEHLASCKDCQEELKQLETLVGGVAFLSTPTEPPQGMKARVLDRVFDEEDNEPVTAIESPRPVPPATPFKQKRERNVPAWGMIALAAALLLSLIGNGYLLSTQSAPPGITLTETIPLDGESEGTAYLAEQDGTTQLIVQTNGLASLDANEVYQVWLLKDNDPIPTGAFVTDDKGNGTVMYTLDASETDVDWDTVAVTKEPSRGSETPQGEIVLIANL